MSGADSSFGLLSGGISSNAGPAVQSSAGRPAISADIAFRSSGTRNPLLCFTFRWKFAGSI